MSNQTKYDAFRQTYPEFVYESYQYDVQPDGLHIVFAFRIGSNILFRPTAFIPARHFLEMNQPRQVMDLLVFNIGMIELVSYWKCYCPPTVRVGCGWLDDDQVAFWKRVYYYGLGEFFYTNGIHCSPDDFLTIQPQGRPIAADPLPTHLDGDAHLVPIGGGKDSVVTLELLRRLPQTSLRPLIMNPRGATIACAAAAGYDMDQVLVIQRTIDPLLLRLNSQGCLNGHTPFSAMLAFYTLLAAQLSGIPHIALSNENSANESTVAGTSVNHQYSKSFQFENDFRQYVSRYLPIGADYYSFLRPLSELQIAMIFSQHEKYFPIFRSCNAGSKTDSWCGKCAKCLFAYIILSPFVAPSRLNHIFGKNMLDDTELQPLFDQLVGKAPTKPFECVGTISEVHAALAMTLSRWYPASRPALLCGFEPAPPSINLHYLFPQHNLSTTELSIITQYVQAAAH